MALIDPENFGIVPEPLPLRTLEQGRADRLARLLPALDGAIIQLATDEQFTLKARAISVAEIAALSGYWLEGPSPQPAVYFKQWAGAPVILHPERVADIATILTRADAVLSALEARLGVAIEPDHIHTEPPQDCEIIALDFHGSVGVEHQMLLAFPRDFSLTTDDANTDFNMTRAPVVVAVDATVAALDVDDAAAIGAGDLLILHGGNWAATMTTPFGAIAGRLDPLANQFSVGHGDPYQGQNAMSDVSEDAGCGFGALRVPVSIKLPEQGLTIEELGRLRAGLAVPIGPIAAGLEVQLTVAGRAVAIGELVRLGDQFAVHIDRIPHDEMPASQPQTMTRPDNSDSDFTQNLHESE